MNIVLLGAPGSGKGTQAEFITKKYGIPQISVGNILRTAVVSGTELGLKVKKIIDNGCLVPDKLAFNLIHERIIQGDCRNGFLLDGFPRTISQATIMSNSGIKINYILEFEVPDIIILERIMGRRVHMRSGRVYHVKFNPPKIANQDDITGEQLIIRKDDQEKTILKRLGEYHKFTKPLIDFFYQKTHFYNDYFKLNAIRNVSEISNELVKILG